jgi:hypothetical protein
MAEGTTSGTSQESNAGTGNSSSTNGSIGVLPTPDNGIVDNTDPSGGAGANGVTDYSGAVGGIGVASSITGTSVTRGVGGDSRRPSPTAGAANTGNGGDNIVNSGGHAGGSGVVILQYPSDFTITIGAGLTGTTATVGANKVTTITAGTGNVSWAA